MARHDLSKVEWRIVEPLLPPAGKGRRREDDRRIVNGIFHVLRTGSPRGAPQILCRSSLLTETDTPSAHSGRSNLRHQEFACS